MHAEGAITLRRDVPEAVIEVSARHGFGWALAVRAVDASARVSVEAIGRSGARLLAIDGAAVSLVLDPGQSVEVALPSVIAAHSLRVRAEGRGATVQADLNWRVDPCD